MVDAVGNRQLLLRSDSPGQTRDIGAALGRMCRGGETVLLVGDLGSGKTCLVQGLAQGLDVPDAYIVTSPTFTLHVEYPGRLVLNHLDLYRLDDAAALTDLGLDDFIGASDSVAAIEWPELMLPELGDDWLRIELSHLGEDARELRFSASGRPEAMLGKLAAK
ncbi:MAG: tRNA (adenosine(37)-N6)-threonylcarbamoyltransferase complex ATPase subunit type 1 TsaE [Planctomycetes bacterium]|nr:tRNA (adenosine(37)-N6)-threonylcarbamoyltransferase complex ATPase subunit type 1 TsaE [Planctomycetota bacterium]